jgi:hypothetical protein
MVQFSENSDEKSISKISITLKKVCQNEVVCWAMIFLGRLCRRWASLGTIPRADHVKSVRSGAAVG